jgi:hypothetical protein
VLAALVALVAILVTGCSSAAPTLPGAAALAGGRAQPGKTGKGRIIVSCLKSYGITKISVKGLFDEKVQTSANFSPAKLELAGDKCWNPSAGMLAQGVKRIDSCMSATGFTAADAGSPLADLLIMIKHSSKDRNALKFCLRT